MNLRARLQVQDLSLRQGQRTLLNELAVEFRPGENWAILGANGSGKTTLLHTLAGLRHPERGQVELDGADLYTVPARQRAQTIGILFQETGSALTTTVLETVLTGRHPFLGRWQQEGPGDLARATSVLGATDLEGLALRQTATLSGGERRRMELATVLVQDAPILLLDEPVNHLDPHYQVDLLNLICERVTRPGHLNLIVLHDINLAMRFCSHGLLLLPGGKYRAGRLSDIVDEAVLQSLYGCAMREIQAGRQRLFFPE